MIEEVLHPGIVGVPSGRHTVDPALVLLEQFAAPVAVVEWWIRKDVVGLEVGVTVGVEGVSVADLRVDATNGEVHLGQSPGSVVRLLPIDGDVADSAAVRLDEFLALHEHAARAAAGIVDAAFVGREHLHQNADDMRGV